MSALGPQTTTDVAPQTTLVIPLGATEQHGPHLPLDTDTRIATAWAEALVHSLEDAVMAPPLPYGSSGEHQAFPGTLSIGQNALATLLIELARSARHHHRRVVFVSGHAGNAQPLQAAVTQLRDEGHSVVGLLPRVSGADAHAGLAETSLMLAIEESLADIDSVANNSVANNSVANNSVANNSVANNSVVKMDRAAAGCEAPLSEIIDQLRSDGVAAVSNNGVLGDPTGATAERGRQLMQELVALGLTEIAAADR